MEKPLLVEIVAYAPTAYYHCTHCEVVWREMGASNQMHEEQTASSLPPDLAEDYQRISDWVREITQLHQDRILVKVIDAASPEGLFKSLRYKIRRYPSVIINRQAFRENDSLPLAEEEIDRVLNREQISSA